MALWVLYVVHLVANFVCLAKKHMCWWVYQGFFVEIVASWNNGHFKHIKYSRSWRELPSRVTIICAFVNTSHIFHIKQTSKRSADLSQLLHTFSHGLPLLYVTLTSVTRPPSLSAMFMTKGPTVTWESTDLHRLPQIVETLRAGVFCVALLWYLSVAGVRYAIQGCQDPFQKAKR